MGVRRTLALFALIMLVGCESFSWNSLNPFGSKEDPAKLASDYRSQLDIFSQVEPVRSGEDVIPTLHVKITNTGNKTIDYMKFVATMDLQSVYHDVRVVKPLTNADGATTLLARDGGTISFIVSFEKIDHAAKWQGNIPLARNVTLSEIRFR